MKMLIIDAHCHGKKINGGTNPPRLVSVSTQQLTCCIIYGISHSKNNTFYVIGVGYPPCTIFSFLGTPICIVFKFILHPT